MKFDVTKQGAGLNVRIDGVAGGEQAVVDAIRRCRGGAWACTSGECVNIETLTERVEAGGVTLELTAKPGVVLDARGIEQCLRYMLPQAGKP